MCFDTSGFSPGGNLTGRTSVPEASSGMPMSADPRGAGPFWEPMCSMGLEDFTYIYHGFMANVGRYSIHGAYGE